MSLFADKWTSPYDSNPFGLDCFRTAFSDCHLESDLSFLRHHSQRDCISPEMRLKHGTSLAERGFYDHFDSISHDLTAPRSRRQDLRNGTASSRRSPQPNGRGKEYVIPITIQLGLPSRGNGVSSATAPKREKAKPVSDSSPGHYTTGQVIQIPIVREHSVSERSVSQDTREKFQFPGSHSDPDSDWVLLTPTTERYGCGQNRDTSNDVILDCDAFFDNSADRSRKSRSRYQSDVEVVEKSADISQRGRSRYQSDIEVVDVDASEETFSRSLRRKPLRHAETDGSVSSKNSLHPSVRIDRSVVAAAESSRKVSLSGTDDATVRDEARGMVRSEEKGGEMESKRPPCSNPGLMDVTPTPSYPIYSHLKPRLAAEGRQVDYVRGDGNCFFRAVSKDVYGSEDYHAEWREAVCDLIERHPDVFRQYIDHNTVTQHLAQMRKLGTWATTCEIYAAATLLQRNVYVLAPSPACEEVYHWLLFSPRALSGSAIGESMVRRASQQAEVCPCFLTLCHTNGNHYDRITPSSVRCNCEMSPPSLNEGSASVDLTAEEGYSSRE